MDVVVVGGLVALDESQSRGGRLKHCFSHTHTHKHFLFSFFFFLPHTKEVTENAGYMLNKDTYYVLLLSHDK